MAHGLVVNNQQAHWERAAASPTLHAAEVGWLVGWYEKVHDGDD